MAQVDFVGYVPFFIWFIVFLLLFYFIVQSFILPAFFSSLKVRSLWFENLLCVNLNLNLNLVVFFKVYFKKRFNFLLGIIIKLIRFLHLNIFSNYFLK